MCVSLLDRRAAGRMAEFCGANGIAILAYGTVAGGFLTERWLGAPEPAESDLATWSLMKYKRFIDVAGGWAVFQHAAGGGGRCRTPAGRVDRERGDSLCAGAAGGGGGDHRRPAWATSARRQNGEAVRLRARCAVDGRNWRRR